MVLVVDTPVDMAVQRLVDERGFDRTDAEARLAAQISREERRALADVVLDNGGDIDALQAQVDRLGRTCSRARAHLRLRHPEIPFGIACVDQWTSPQ